MLPTLALMSNCVMPAYKNSNWSTRLTFSNPSVFHPVYAYISVYQYRIKKILVCSFFFNQTSQILPLSYHLLLSSNIHLISFKIFLNIIRYATYRNCRNLYAYMKLLHPSPRPYMARLPQSFEPI